MQRLEVSGAVRPLYGSLGFKGLNTRETWQRHRASVKGPYMISRVIPPSTYELSSTRGKIRGEFLIRALSLAKKEKTLMWKAENEVMVVQLGSLMSATWPGIYGVYRFNPSPLANKIDTRTEWMQLWYEMCDINSTQTGNLVKVTIYLSNQFWFLT